MATTPMIDSAKPYTRWWWLGGPFTEGAIRYQLDWLRDHGFGGVELAWITPVWLGARHRNGNPTWLGDEWRALVGYTKRYADSVGLGCDFTFGSVWPFGGRCVAPEDGSQMFNGFTTDPVHYTWEDAEPGSAPVVVDHLNAAALRRYVEAMRPAFGPLCDGVRPAFFCDSFEIDKRKLWSPALWDRFSSAYGYDLKPFCEHLPEHEDVLYDYRRFIGDTVVREFYGCFTECCHDMGAVSRVQCHGAPADLIAAYSVVDIPESEALLFPTHFSRIPASAAALSEKPVVSCETFTCIYGFTGPRHLEALKYWKRENVADLKLLADAVFANGVNRIVWQGMPFNAPGGPQEFFASVHVGPGCSYEEEVAPFNAYIERVSSAMSAGSPVSRLAVYLPNEDYMVKSTMPVGVRVPGEQDLWEMRRVRVPDKCEGYHPLWVSRQHLERANVRDGALYWPHLTIPALYVDVELLDLASLETILRLGRAGARVVLKRTPAQPGHVTSASYSDLLTELRALPTTRDELHGLDVAPLVTGDDLPWFWARAHDDRVAIFFAHPLAKTVRYPMPYGCAAQAEATERHVEIRVTPEARPTSVELRFPAFGSLLVSIKHDGAVDIDDGGYTPPSPATE